MQPFKTQLLLTAFTVLLCFCTTSCAHQLPPQPTTTATTFQKIDGLNGSNVLCGYCLAPQQGHNSSKGLLDEQERAGDPANTANQSNLNPMVSSWNPGFVTWSYPRIFALIDLGAVYDINAVWISTLYGGVFGEVRLGLSPFVDEAADVDIKINSSLVPNHCDAWGWKVGRGSVIVICTAMP